MIFCDRMANPAWKKTAEKMRPPNVSAKNEKPLSNLALKHVFGYRGFDKRNNLKYLTDNASHVIYHAAGLVISQTTNMSLNVQSYFGGHVDDITCLDIWKPKSEESKSGEVLVASGEMGKTPCIHLSKWILDDPSSGKSHFGKPVMKP